MGDSGGKARAHAWFRVPCRALAGRPHLTAVLVIMVLFAGALLSVQVCIGRLESQYVHTLLVSPEEYHALRSLAIERCALRQPDLLPLFGSSELIKPVPGRATVFFRSYPTGFSVFPIGKPGTYPLIMLQHVGSMGAELRGKKVAISLSAGWFRESEVIPDQYRGNFLLPTAREFLFNSEVSEDLRCAAARRFLAFPETLAGDPLTCFAARHLAAGSWYDRLAVRCAWPLGWLQIFISRCQDRFEVLWSALRLLPHHDVRRVPTTLDWPKLIASVSRPAGKGSGDGLGTAVRQTTKGDEQFLAEVKASPVWGDLDLLLQSLQAVGARPLLLCTPLKGEDVKGGASAAARAVFYRQLEEIAARYHFPLLDFADHDMDEDFLRDRNDHLSEKGWMYYDRALDDFVHDGSDL